MSMSSAHRPTVGIRLRPIDATLVGIVLLFTSGPAGCAGDAAVSDDSVATAVVSPAAVGPRTLVPEPLVEALAEALDDERHAIAFYEAVMATYGVRRPFANIVNAERRHEQALLAQYRRLGLEVPPNRRRADEIEVPSSFREACRLSAEAEVRNVAIYDRIIAVAADPTSGDPEVARVFERLRWASQERHLPAFRRCSGG